MTMFKETLEAVMSGRKTQTSRLPKDGETFDPTRNAVLHKSGKIKWQVGHSYAIQPDYGTKQVGRYRVLALAKRDVRDFTQADAEREGFDTLYDFWMVWCGMYDKHSYEILTDYEEFQGDNLKNINMTERALPYLKGKSKKDKNYIAWVIGFELVNP